MVQRKQHWCERLEDGYHLATLPLPDDAGGVLLVEESTLAATSKSKLQRKERAGLGLS